jgi:hypothetical protein
MSSQRHHIRIHIHAHVHGMYPNLLVEIETATSKET